MALIVRQRRQNTNKNQSGKGIVGWSCYSHVVVIGITWKREWWMVWNMKFKLNVSAIFVPLSSSSLFVIQSGHRFLLKDTPIRFPKIITEMFYSKKCLKNCDMISWNTLYLAFPHKKTFTKCEREFKVNLK